MTNNTEENKAKLNTGPNINVHKGPDYRSIYVNWVQPSFTPFDISLLIGEAANRERATPADPETVDIEVKARLAFHPAEARIVAQLLLQTLAAYEKQVGAVPNPKGVDVPKKTTTDGI